MKKLYLAVVLVFLSSVNNAKADMHGEFVRVECNPALGFFEIKEQTIYGERANDFFDENDAYIKYSSDNDKFKTEVYWVNSDVNIEKAEPFTYRCQISDTLAYDIEIKPMEKGDCDYRANNLVNITEISRNPNSGKVEEQKFIQNVLLGCNGKVDEILWSQHSTSRNEYKIFFKWRNLFEGESLFVYQDDRNPKPITEKAIETEFYDMLRRSEELEREQKKWEEEWAKLLGKR